MVTNPNAVSPTVNPNISANPIRINPDTINPYVTNPIETRVVTNTSTVPTVDARTM